MVKSEKFYRRSRNTKFIGAICLIVVGAVLFATSMGLLPKYINHLKEIDNAKIEAVNNGYYAELMTSGEHFEMIREQRKQETNGLSILGGSIAAEAIAIALLKMSERDDNKADEERKKEEKAKRAKNVKQLSETTEEVAVEAE